MEDNLQKSFETNQVGTNKLTQEILPYIDVNGDFKIVTGKDAIIAKIKNLLMTPLGTYPFDPQYGSLLYKQLFELCNDVTEKQIYYEVSDRITKYIDEVIVESVQLYWKVPQKECYVSVYLYIQNDCDRTPLTLDIKKYGESMYDSIDDPEYGNFMF